MENQQTSESCDTCGLLLQDDRHGSPEDCIRGLRKAMIKQRKAAELLSFEVSTRYLVIIEDIAINATGDAAITAAIMQDIYRRYAGMGDWSPLKEQEERILEQGKLIDLCLRLHAQVFTEQYAVACGGDELHQLKEIGRRATQLGVLPPDLADSKSPLR